MSYPVFGLVIFVAWCVLPFALSALFGEEDDR